MVVINSDDQGPELLLVLLGRFLWRYRSELMPLVVCGAAFLVSALMHPHHAGWWIPILVATIVMSVLLGIPQKLLRRTPAGSGIARILEWWWRLFGIDRPVERYYAAVIVATCGGWLTVAIADGPITKPLPNLAFVATVVLGVPWWIHRRRRARVQVSRAIAAWPDISENVGLPGSYIASVAVDMWGWTARVVLRKGTTSDQAIRQLPNIESGLGIRPGSARALPDESRADRFILRVIETDPHAKAIAWPHPSNTSITQPVVIGLFEDGEPVAVTLLRRNVLIGGIMGSGKSGVLNVILAVLVVCADVEIWGVDLKGGMELNPWAPCLHKLATTPEHANALLQGAIVELNRRATLMAANNRRVWEPTPDNPAIVIVIDEYAELSEEAKDYADSIARRGRAVAVNLLIATQRPTQDAMGNNAVRSQMDVRICLRVRERDDVDLILGQGAYSSGWHAHKLTKAGSFLISDPEHHIPQRARAYLVDDETVKRHVRANTNHPYARTEEPPALTAPQSASEPPREAHGADEQPDAPDGPESALWAALLAAGPDGVPVAELLEITGMTRPTLYRHLNALVKAGRAVQTTRGRWRATSPGGS